MLLEETKYLKKYLQRTFKMSIFASEERIFVYLPKGFTVSRMDLITEKISENLVIYTVVFLRRTRHKWLHFVFVLPLFFCSHLDFFPDLLHKWKSINRSIMQCFLRNATNVFSQRRRPIHFACVSLNWLAAFENCLNTHVTSI